MNTLSYRTISANKATVEKKWLVVDADGQTLGRLASQVAYILRGKHKPGYTPHVDCGDHVVVINAEKIKLSGKKWLDKEYIWHSGYPGGQRNFSAKQMMERNPIRMVEIAVKGMLPHNRLGSELYRSLHVVAGSEHPHAAQQPEPFELKYK